MIKNKIPYGKQHITDEDIDSVVATLKSDFLTQGPQIQHFEETFAGYVGSRYAVAVANGTAALHLSVLALGLDEGDTVITTPITFAASANCIRYAGGNVDFVDIDPKTYLIDVDAIRHHLVNSPSKRIKGLIPVDFAGRAVDMEEIRKIADEFGLWIIEDACHAPGGYFVDSKHNRQHCGNGAYADLAIFSFHPVKHIACGEGGMITTNNENLYRKLLQLRTHGITRDPASFVNAVQFAAADQEAREYPGWYMEMQSLGFNYRLTDFQAALGISQLKRADQGLVRRREIASRYAEALQNEEFILGQSGLSDGHAYHLYIIEVERRLELYNYLKTKNIIPQVHYIPTHLMPYYRQYGWREGMLPNSETYYKHCLSLPMYPTLTNEEQDDVINQIKSFYHG
jgi:UDP-4-amino-4,6-dideoxy-N-acetyl-beta-L-altrosamine transaminase